MSSRRFGRGAVMIALSLMCLLGAHASDLEQDFADHLARARSGDIQAMYAVGEMYELGMGTASSRTEALNWYRAAAQKGHPEGAYQVGYAYYWGKGVTRDRRQAHLWFERAAEGGSQAAMPYLSKMYALGQGVPQDKEKAEQWAQRANTASNLHTPPPAPEVRRAPAPAVEPAPEPAAVVQVPEPAAKPKPTPKPEPEAAPPPKPAPRVATKPAPAPTPKPPATRKPKPSPAQASIERLLASHWEKAGRPALYLPSSQTSCEAKDELLTCRSAARRSSLLGRPYAFRLVASISGFDARSDFTISYRPEVTGVLQAPPGGYADDGAEAITEEQLRERVEREPEQLSCRLRNATTLSCTDGRGQEQVFEGVKPKPAEQAVSRPPSDSGRTSAAPRPSPPQQQAAQEESQRTRIFGPRP